RSDRAGDARHRRVHARRDRPGTRHRGRHEQGQGVRRTGAAEKGARRFSRGAVTMDDNTLDELLADAVRSYRPPPAAPLDAIWERVEAEAFAAPRARRTPGWTAFGGAIAATLIFGVLIGRATSA